MSKEVLVIAPYRTMKSSRAVVRSLVIMLEGITSMSQL
jgi:hypothetical protein